MAIKIGERAHDELEQQRRLNEQTSANMRVCIPGIIQSFNAENQTVAVQPSISERVEIDNEIQEINLPLLEDVPIQFPRSGGYAITLPVKEGDECLLVFGDMCIDAWWQSGGIQNQMESRRHDLSDAFAILAVTSVPNAVKDYKTDRIKILHEETDTHIEIFEEDINIKAKTINITADNVINIKTPVINIDGNIVQNGQSTVSIDEIIKQISFVGHTHTGVHGETSPPH